MPSEYRIHLTPDEAAAGTTRTIELPSGTMTVRVPPALSGRLFKVPTSQGEILVRIEIETDSESASTSADSESASAEAEPIGPVPTAPGPTRRRPSNARLTVPLMLIALGITFGALKTIGSNDDGHTAAGIQVTLTTPDDGDPALDYPAPDDTYPNYPPPSDLASEPPNPFDTDEPDPLTAPNPASSPYATGTCFNGTPAGLTTVTISMFDPVTCSSSGTVYEVVKVLMGTTDTDGCSGIVAAFVYTITDNGTYSDGTAWQAVYCLEAYS